jgi:tRNA(adenine34) deaminase
MCAGAIVNSRMGRVVFGAKDAKAGAMGSVLQMNSYPLNHKTKLEGEVLAKECADVLRAFFATKRQNKKD